MKGGAVLWRYDAGVAGLCKPGSGDKIHEEIPLKSSHLYRAKVISKQAFPLSGQNLRTFTPKNDTMNEYNSQGFPLNTL